MKPRAAPPQPIGNPNGMLSVARGGWLYPAGHVQVTNSGPIFRDYES
jgi:hypothetical protein